MYKIKLTIPKNTPANNPAKAEVTVEPGVVRKIEILFPADTEYKAHVRFKHGDHIFEPSNPEEWLEGEYHPIIIYTKYFIRSHPYKIIMEGYNEDTTYDFTVRAHITMVMPLIPVKEGER